MRAITAIVAPIPTESKPDRAMSIWSSLASVRELYASPGCARACARDKSVTDFARGWRGRGYIVGALLGAMQDFVQHRNSQRAVPRREVTGSIPCPEELFDPTL